MQKNNQHNHEIGCTVCKVDSERYAVLDSNKILIIIVSGIILTIGLYLEFFTRYHLFAQILFFFVAILSGYTIVKRGLQSLLKKQLNINFLISIAAAGAFLIGHGEEGAAVIFLFFIAEFLEDYAEERAKKSIASLLSLAPETAIVRRNGKEIEVHVHEIDVGEIIVVKPGDKIPLDGVIIKGNSSVNQAPITGESIPVTKRRGDEVFAGTINEEGYLEIKVTKKSDETLLSKIVKLVEEAEKQKSKTEAFIDRFAKYYTPAVIILSFFVMVIPPLIFGLPFMRWFYKGLVLLVISCPCALAISTPVSIVSAITSAAKNGVLIKGGNFIEEIKNTKVIVFDKTGTLTEGKLEVTDIVVFNAYPKEELLQTAASLEAKSKHPIAEAIVNSAEKRKISLVEVSEFKSIVGKGLKGKINGRAFYVGNKSFFNDNHIVFPVETVKKLENEGKTVVMVGNDSQVIGIIALMDKIRDVSLSTIRELKKMEIKTIMLTGDNERVAKAIAKKLSIDEYYAELLPEDKVRIVEKLLEKYGHVIMVGDGVNDAPALAKANVGIAMGAIGSDVAIETADIALMHDDLSKIVYLIGLSKKTISVVKQNISASLLIKGSFAILTFPGIVTLWMAVAVGDMGLSLAVILNALRIGRKK
ncbi:MAG: cadmium-translocating P-type ATPase [Thermoplasmata archaeon]|nr:MAG: cadmium-translocating P-type ATPase [Thermoplasmata archaeon]